MLGKFIKGSVMSKQQELEAERFIHRAMQYLKSTFP